MQGCLYRCLYCHNPDSWDLNAGRQMSVEEILAEIEPYVEYYRRSGGGITVSGGEPTLQAPFVAELFRECKERWGLHTALDSNGFCDPAHAGNLLDVTDLVLLDLKYMDDSGHVALTEQSNARVLSFARHLSERKVKLWLRRVLVPGYTDDAEDLLALGRFAAELEGVERIEVLPYHRMGAYKWEQLKMKYPLEGVLEPSTAEVERAKRFIEQGRQLPGSSGITHILTM